MPRRLLALLLSLGMIFISTQSRDLAPIPAEVTAVIDVTDDVPCEFVVAVGAHAPGSDGVELPQLLSQAPSYRYESSVFRPPRAALA